MLLVWMRVVSTLVDLDLQKISGFWREVGLASEFNMALDAGMKVEGLFITLSGRNMTVKAAYNNSGSCETEKVVGSGRDMGKFAFPARSLDREDEPGFWRFRELTADTGLYLVSRHRRCAKLLKEVSPHPSVCTEDPSPGSVEP
ncbi:epididymal-specific lipocalin-8 isoform X3 [Urocitellus parryii]|uniref:epididymal-specific lipocalin-8 isoform X3 n=1 Tax=Urocitellus parryii TaxID=9999 RepID=UPI000E55CD83|nr:epididymal-specific lipocalin-8 isoform X3 [Urocitellus parryii]